MRKLIPLILSSLFFFVISVNGQGDFNKKKKDGAQKSNITPGPVKDYSRRPVSPSSTLDNSYQSKRYIKKDTIVPRQFNLNSQKKVIYSKETGLPSFISTPREEGSYSVKSSAQQVPALCYNYLNEIKHILKLDDPENQFSITQTHTDAFNKTHIRLDQVHKGVKVHGAQVMVHLDKGGRGELFNGQYNVIKEDITTDAAITSDEAMNKAKAHLSERRKLATETSGTFLVEKQNPASELVIYKQKDFIPKYTLVYHITLYTANFSRWEYFIDATIGEVVHFFENTCYLDGAKTATAKDLGNVTRTVNTYQIGSTYFMLDASRSMYNSSASNLPDEPSGGILTIDLNNTWGENQSFQHVISSSNVWDNPTAISAHYYAGLAYEYYLSKHGRMSIDGNSGTIFSIINVPDDETGQSLGNAFWSGKYMCYGNGDNDFYPLARALDVAGHEMTHGVIQHTANLEYDGESGAINESMADIFGKLVEGDENDWVVGEDVVKLTSYPTGALRSFSDPHNGGTSISDVNSGYQPAHVSEKYTGEGDNHGVHVNSGIPNHAFYLFAHAIGLEKAEAVYYKTLTDYLTKSSQFVDLRLAVIQATTDLYGAAADEVQQAKNAFDAVGIVSGEATDATGTLPENPGEEFLLLYNTDASDLNSLYRSSSDNSEIIALTQDAFISRPSVTDDGSFAIFVAEDNTIHGVNTRPGTDPDEWVMSDETIWSNAVVSKDGNRIAAVTNDSTDASVWVYDFVSEQWNQFELYNPTYTDVIAPGPMYADALEFDYSGEFLVYDAFNRLEGSDGGSIEYWDVNFIYVWDSQTGSFGDGSIMKLFSGLPDGVSIGNPSFSKNSPHIIAFDYIDEGLGEYAIVGCNIETNEVNVIATNNTVGWPSYNKSDSRLAFTSINTDENYETDYVILNPDKISSDGNAVIIFTDAAWPVYFATGERDYTLSVSEESLPKAHILSYPNPFSDEVSFILSENLKSSGLIEIFNQSGQIVFTEKYDKNSGENLKMDLKELASGYYIVKIRNDKTVATGKILKK